MISFTTGLDIGGKNSVAYVFSHNYAKIKVDSYDSLTLEKIFTFYSVILHIKSVGRKIKVTTTMIFSKKNILTS